MSLSNRKDIMIGNQTDKKICEIIGIPQRTLTNWSASNGYKNTLYWILKTLTEEELQELIKKTKLLKESVK